MAEEQAAGAVGLTAGGLLRQAREAQGLHIAALAASLKIPQRKLEALERDRFDELPDATFTRALAQTVCRALKIDPVPVLALLPRADAGALDQVSAGLNAPFRERPTALDPALGPLLRHPATAVVALLLVGAVAFWWWPRTPAPAPAPVELVVPSAPPASAPAAVAEVASAALQAPSQAASQPMVETVHSAPAADPAASAAPVATAGPGVLSLRTREASWIEVVDGSNRPLLSRTVLPGESVGLDGPAPLRLTIGNASATEVSFRGQPVNLVPLTRDNIARVELK
jgi:cytoskeleton protein RodZ